MRAIWTTFNYAQIAATVRTTAARIKFATFAQSSIRDTRAAAQSGRSGLLWRRFILPFVDGRVIFLGHSNQQVFERQFQLLDLAFDLL